MATKTIITLTDPYASREQVCDIYKNGHGRLPLHLVSECASLAGINPNDRDVRCSVCGQTWDERVVVSQHEACADLMSDGSRRYAHPVITYGAIEIRQARYA